MIRETKEEVQLQDEKSIVQILGLALQNVKTSISQHQKGKNLQKGKSHQKKKSLQKEESHQKGKNL